MAFKRDWVCKKCGAKSLDVPTSVPDQWCPMCGTEMEKVITTPVVLFNGTGWTPTYHGQTRVIRDDHRHDDFDKDWKKIAAMGDK